MDIRAIFKEIKKYGETYYVDVRINSLETEEDGCMDLLELYFSDDHIPEGFTPDDCISYEIADHGLVLKWNYQRDDLEDLPYLINDKKTLKRVIKDFSI